MSLKPHRRWNPMKGDWILVSPHRMNRPWSGQVEKGGEEAFSMPEFDPKNPLCPGVARPSGTVNPDYKSTFVFDNDFPALLQDEDKKDPNASEDELFRTEPASGTCRVMCFHPKSNVTVPLMTAAEMEAVVERWVEQARELGERYRWVQIFENKGAVMGCSNPHPHCQIWASTFLPNEASVKDENFRRYYEKSGGRPMLLDYAAREMESRERVVCDNADWVALVPFWAMWPFETMLLPKTRHVKNMAALDSGMRKSLAEIMQRLTSRYDNLFETNFPYSMGFHGAPSDPDARSSVNDDHWQLHALYFPPLLRSATVKKFMVGYEMLANAQRDLTAEQAAERLRAQPEVHYTRRKAKIE